MPTPPLNQSTEAKLLSTLRLYPQPVTVGQIGRYLFPAWSEQDPGTPRELLLELLGRMTAEGRLVQSSRGDEPLWVLEPRFRKRLYEVDGQQPSAPPKTADAPRPATRPDLRNSTLPSGIAMHDPDAVSHPHPGPLPAGEGAAAHRSSPIAPRFSATVPFAPAGGPALSAAAAAAPPDGPAASLESAAMTAVKDPPAARAKPKKPAAKAAANGAAKAQTKKFIKAIPVTFGGVNIGQGTARVGIVIARSAMELADADEMLCGRRIVGWVRLESHETDAKQQTLMDDMAHEIRGAFDVKGVRFTPDSFSTGLTFSTRDIDIRELGHFAKETGRLYVEHVAELVDVAAQAGPDEDDDEEGDDDED